MEFTACSKDSLWCTIAYWMTESAGKIGTLLIIIIASYFYTVRFESNKQKAKTFFRSVLAIGLLLAVFAFFNEHVTKKALKLIRPSHTFVMEHSGISMQTDLLYDLEEEERKQLIQHTIDSHSENFTTIDKKVLAHWIEESGYSFPSGHSFNAFLLACVLGFSMYHSRNRIAKLLYFLPFIWATLVGISRVAIGAHSALDVSFGAAMGVLVAFLFLYFEHTKKLILPAKSKI